MDRLPPFLTWFQAITWITTDGAEVGEPYQPQCISWALDLADAGDPLPVEPLLAKQREVEQQLIDAATRGKITVIGIPGPDPLAPGRDPHPSPLEGTHEAIKTEAWAGLDDRRRVTTHRRADGGLSSYLRLGHGKCFHDLQIAANDLRKMRADVVAASSLSLHVGIPNRPWLSLCEAVSLLAFGVALDTEAVLAMRHDADLSRYADAPERLVRALEIRLCGDRKAMRAEKTGSMELFNNPHGEGKNVKRLRQRLGLSPAELLDKARAAEARIREHEAKWDGAVERLFTRASDPHRRVHLRGVLHRDGEPTTTERTEIPLGFFLNGELTAFYDSTIRRKGPMPLVEILSRSKAVPADWRDVKVSAHDLGMHMLNQEEPPVPPRLQDLPAAWSLLECLAWIMLRDTAAVRDAAVEGPSARRPLRSWLSIALSWSYQSVHGAPAVGPGSCDKAEEDLLSRLRSGALAGARGRLNHGEPRPMEPADWRGLRLFEVQDGTLYAESSGRDRHVWSDITIPRDAIVAIWPSSTPLSRSAQDGVKATPRDGPNDSEPASTFSFVAPARRPQYTVAGLRAWFAGRRAAWPNDAALPTEREDLAAARAHFEGDIPRDPFREIRRQNVPESWRKPGPRKSR